jgi:hypothetical protein
LYEEEVDALCKEMSHLNVSNFVLLIIYKQSETYTNKQIKNINKTVIITKNPSCIRDANLLDVLFILVSAKTNLFFPNCMSE